MFGRCVQWHRNLYQPVMISKVKHSEASGRTYPEDQMMYVKWFHRSIVTLSVIALPLSLGAQSAKKDAAPAPASQVKAGAVTINMPEGMTKDQADAILNELKAIHQLLLNQQAVAK